MSRKFLRQLTKILEGPAEQRRMHAGYKRVRLDWHIGMFWIPGADNTKEPTASQVLFIGIN